MGKGPRTVFSSAVGLTVFQPIYKRANEFLHRLINFSMCTELAGKICYVTVTLEPVSDAHAHEGILTVLRFSNANNSKWISLSCIIGHVHRIVTVLVVEI